MNRILRGTIVFLGVLGLLKSNASLHVAWATAEQDGSSQASLQASKDVDIEVLNRTCGPRCLYVWLRLEGKDIHYKDVLRVVPVTDQGSSLQQLVDASRNWGCALKAVKIPFNDLDRLALPAIAHVWIDGRQASRGHYLVLLRIQANAIEYIDPSKGTLTTTTPARFREVWSGYLLIRDDPLVRWNYYAGVVLLAVLITLGGPIAMRGRSLKRLSLPVVIICAGCMTCGCQRLVPEGLTSPARVNQEVTANRSSRTPEVLSALKTSSTAKHLGTVPLGSEAFAEFTLSNSTSQTLSLKLGRPTCGCLKATLQDETLGSHELTTLRLTLGGSIFGFAGPRGGSVAVGTQDPRENIVFTATGIIEGMITHPYAIRYPRDVKTFKPGPITGEIVFGPRHLEAQARIVQVLLIDEGEQVLRLDAPTVYPAEEMGSYKRCRFQIPVQIVDASQLQPKTYQCRITYRVDGRAGDYGMVINIFPRADVGPK